MKHLAMRLLSIIGIVQGSFISLGGFYGTLSACFGYVGETSCPRPTIAYVLGFGGAGIALVSAGVLVVSFVKLNAIKGGTAS